jgi:hypothetical protein
VTKFVPCLLVGKGLLVSKRCPATEKNRYANERDAQRAAGGTYSQYSCDHCGGWHLTRKGAETAEPTGRTTRVGELSPNTFSDENAAKLLALRAALAEGGKRSDARSGKPENRKSTASRKSAQSQGMPRGGGKSGVRGQPR